MKMSEIGQKLIDERNYSILIAVSVERGYVSFLVVDFSSLMRLSMYLSSWTLLVSKRTFLRFTSFSRSRYFFARESSCAWFRFCRICCMWRSSIDLLFSSIHETYFSNSEVKTWQPVALRSELIISDALSIFLPRSNFVFHAFTSV